MQCNMWDEKKYTIKNVHEFTAHTGGCYTIAFDPSEKEDAFCDWWRIRWYRFGIFLSGTCV